MILCKLQIINSPQLRIVADLLDILMVEFHKKRHSFTYNVCYVMPKFKECDNFLLPQISYICVRGQSQKTFACCFLLTQARLSLNQCKGLWSIPQKTTLSEEVTRVYHPLPSELIWEIFDACILLP